MKLPETQLAATSLETCLEFFAENYKFLGDGSYAEVFQINKNSVAKIGAVNGDSYMMYVECIGENTANVHLPKIESIQIHDPEPNSPFSEPYYIIKMERLIDRIDLIKRLKARYKVEYLEVQDMIDNYFTERGIKDGYSLMPGVIQETVPFTKDMQEVQEILMHLFNNGAGPDLADRNIMWRYDEKSGQFDAVFTDPVT